MSSSDKRCFLLETLSNKPCLFSICPAVLSCTLTFNMLSEASRVWDVALVFFFFHIVFFFVSFYLWIIFITVKYWTPSCLLMSFPLSIVWMHTFCFQISKLLKCLLTSTWYCPHNFFPFGFIIVGYVGNGRMNKIILCSIWGCICLSLRSTMMRYFNYVFTQKAGLKEEVLTFACDCNYPL